jgi:hypothetical protein
MFKPRWRKATVLLQTLVMSVILSMMGVMVLKWVLGRYLLSARTFRSTTVRMNAQGYYDTLFPVWYVNSTTADDKTQTITNSANGNSLSQCVHVSLAGGVVTIKANEDADSATCP